MSKLLSSGTTASSSSQVAHSGVRNLSHTLILWWSWSRVVSLGEEDEAGTHPSAPPPLPTSAAAAAAAPVIAQVWIWSLADYLVRCHTSVCFRCAWHCWLALMPIRLADLIELVW